MNSGGKVTSIIPENKPSDLLWNSFRIYGLTGGAGSGKSEVAKVLENHNIPVIYADRVGHDLLNEPVIQGQLVSNFGDEILKNGKIDREKLRKQVFGDKKALERLNLVVHPIMAVRIEQRCRELWTEGARLVVIDGALLCENGEKSGFLDGLIVVHCDKEKQIERLIKSRQITRREAVQIIEAQADPYSKLQIADWVIENNNSLEALHTRAHELAEELWNHACGLKKV